MKTEYKGFTVAKHFQEAEQKYCPGKELKQNKDNNALNHFRFLKKMSSKL